VRALFLGQLVPTAAALSGCATTSSTLTVHGQLVADEPVSLPPDGLMVVELARRRRRPRAHRTAPAAAQPAVPLPFRLQLQRERLQPSHRLEVRGALPSQGWAQWLSPLVAIDGSAAVIEVGALRLQRAARPLAFQSQIDCGARRFTVGMHGDTMRLLDGDAFYDLRNVPAASGDRLEAVGDPTTFVQTEGRRARFGVRGVLYADCSVSR
jgi:Type III secretion system lipoprotein chaperone (YscW)